MTKKWYLSTGIIAIMFGAWILLIPPIIGIILIVLRHKQDKTNEMLYQENLQRLQVLEKKTKQLGFKRYEDVSAAVDNLKNELDELTNKKEVKKQEILDETKAERDAIIQSITSKKQEIETLNADITKKKEEIKSLKEKIISFENDILFQEFGLYEPRYDFLNSDEYKNRITQIRTYQKDMIKNNTAISGVKNWTVNGSVKEGTKMVKDTQKLLLRAFNNECDDTINRVKYNNVQMSEQKIQKSAEAIEKLGRTMSLYISSKYIDYKIQELYLAHEYQQKKQEEKEAQKAARAEMREAAKLQKEIEEQRKKFEKEKKHYSIAYNKIQNQLSSDPTNEELLAKADELQSQLENIDTSLNDIDYREANQKAGYVYIISNTGAFGENIYKIGMTRRLNPQERIDELSGASVPFSFDVHAMIFSDDAPRLEASLHRAFEDKKVNMVNARKEFFNVSLDEIKKVIKENYDKTVEFIDYADAEQYRISQKMREIGQKVS